MPHIAPQPPKACGSAKTPHVARAGADCANGQGTHTNRPSNTHGVDNRLGAHSPANSAIRDDPPRRAAIWRDRGFSAGGVILRRTASCPPPPEACQPSHTVGARCKKMDARCQHKQKSRAKARRTPSWKHTLAHRSDGEWEVVVTPPSGRRKPGAAICPNKVGQVVPGGGFLVRKPHSCKLAGWAPAHETTGHDAHTKKRNKAKR